MVLAGTPVAASACALWCPPGMGHVSASGHEAPSRDAQGASLHDACRESGAESPAPRAAARHVLPAQTSAVADVDCCSVERAGTEVPRTLERLDPPSPAAASVVVPRPAAPRRAAGRAPDPPRSLPRLSRTAVLRI